MKKILRRIGIAALSIFCLAVAVFPAAAVAQTYPTKPIRMIAPNAPGSGTDVIGRLIGTKLSELLGQQVVIDNRSGADGRIGMEVAARAAPDGYNLVVVTSANAVSSATFENLKYDLVKDFSSISLLGTTPHVLIVVPSLRATSVTELVALAKSRPGELKYGEGSMSQRLAAEIFKYMAGCDIFNVPYKGSSAPVMGALTGEVQMAFPSIPMVTSMIKDGKFRALGVTSAKRTPLVPDIPAISEFVPGYSYSGWYAIVAPAKTPPAIISKLHGEVVKILRDKTIQERMVVLGVDILASSPQECDRYMREEVEKMKEAVKKAGITSGS
jgi:tripartite-type tricarboxylate transporter receptor subunit TctC